MMIDPASSITFLRKGLPLFEMWVKYNIEGNFSPLTYWREKAIWWEKTWDECKREFFSRMIITEDSLFEKPDIIILRNDEVMS